MKLLLDFLPILVFFAAFKLFDIWVATGVAIAATVAQIAWLRWRTGKVEPIAKVEIKSKANGIIERLHVDVGDIVKPGDVLAELQKLGCRPQFEAWVRERMAAGKSN